MHVTMVERMFTVWQGRRKTPEVHDAATHNAYEASTDNHHSPTTAGTNEAQLLHTNVVPFAESVQQD
jgi:hypothetical protein